MTQPAARIVSLGAPALRGRVACIDLETTGGMAVHHRIIEVGIVLLENGEIVEEWSSLVNPGARIPSPIEDFTGISNAMVADAPAFDDLRDEVRRRLDGRLFVAHNARFDYGFVRNEYRRLGEKFSAPVLCTVRLSRALFREHARHNLDALIERYGLACGARHRALGDAAVLPPLLAAFEAAAGIDRLQEAAAAVLNESRLPPHLPPDLAEDLPEGPGVYLFRGEGGALLYVGKSRNLRGRVIEHFAAEHRSSKEAKLTRQVRAVEWVETGGELGALLLESRLVKELAPAANRRLRKPAGLQCVRLVERAGGVEACVEPLETPAAGEGVELYGPFRTERDARRALEGKAREAGLCLKVMGLERGEGSCFAYQLGRCRGACVGKEPRALHDARLKLALASLRLKAWPFPGPVGIRERGPMGEGSVLHVLDQWRHLGTAATDTEVAALLERSAEACFDPDAYRIIARCLGRLNPRDLVPLGRDRGCRMSVEAGSTFEFFAACPRHVPDLLGGELRALGLNVTREHPAGVSFTGTLRDGYLACLASRTASRVLLALGTVPLDTPEAMYAAIRAMPWEEHLAPDGTLAIDVVGQGPAWLRHSQFAAQKAKDAIVDRFRERSGARPSVDLGSPDLRLNLSLMRQRGSLAIDLSGEPLHRRGYRQSGVEAPLKENLAAALLLRCGWPAIAADGGAFVDPMCGSGTLVIEAALMAADVAPGLLRRKFGFERWRQHRPEVWEELRTRAQARRRPEAVGPGRFRGYDRDQGAIRAALANSGRCGVGDHIVFERRDLAQCPKAVEARGLVLVNPPYGARLDDVASLEPAYALLGAKLMECFPGWEAGVLTGHPPLGRALRLRAYRSHTFFNGPIECRLLRFELRPDAVEPDPATVRRNRLEAARARPGSAMFGNRLRKNLARLEAWAKRSDVACFRVYDADMPEYAFAIDLYGNDQRWAYVQEYAAPATVDAGAARGRRDEVLAVLPEILGLPEERVVLRVRRRQKGGEQYEKVGEAAQFHAVREGGYRFLVNFTDYLDTGLFLDHRVTRRRIGELAAGRPFLNLFAYTGTATVYAAGGGATSTTTVDMSRTYLDWAKRNLALNGLAGPQHGFVQADCLAWLEEQGAVPRRRYGLVFVDPPTLSRSKRMEREFDVQRDHARLLAMTARLLEPGGVIVFSNNFQKFRLDAAVAQAFEVEDLTRATLPEDFARNPRIHSCFLLRPRAAG